MKVLLSTRVVLCMVKFTRTSTVLRTNLLCNVIVRRMQVELQVELWREGRWEKFRSALSGNKEDISQ